MTAIIFVCLLIVGFVIAVGVEYGRHRRNLAAIPIRLHVNGTRGKSSVTRLLVWALNEAGIKTFGKTTGTLPRMIFPDGKEYPVYRPGGRSNVLEQIRIVAVARAHDAKAVVMECMALQPRYQWLSEEKLVQATHGVVTNAREDHLDVMGPTERDVALALAGMVPRGNRFFTCEERNLDVFRTACEDRKSELHAVSSKDTAAVSDEDMKGFAYQEHKENVALCLSICKSLNVDREVALRGMRRAIPDEGAMKTFTVDFFGRCLNFVNGFAANDPESTERIWRMAIDAHPGVEKKIAVFNLRMDRQHRTWQLAHAYAKWPKADVVILMGTGTYLFDREAAEEGCDPSGFIHREGADAAGVFESILSHAGRSAVIVGMANIAGAGLDLVHYFENRSIFKETVG